MRTIEELRAQMAERHDALRRAIDAAAGAWDARVLEPEAPETDDDATGEPWTPRDVLEHVVEAEFHHASLVLFAIGGAPLRLDSPEKARRVLDGWATFFDAMLEAMEDEHLPAEVELEDGQHRYMQSLGIPPLDTVEGVLRLCAGNIGDHAEQLERAG